ncbi:hypothetical protein [Intrasporangium sp.]|uniref:hypothetical protein n=1 Tax=Intrasporangium sp. TaxID=1925024 RepID=UPI00293AC43F|nr:hypothetical protein [Intrasporangium sp.]MDV3220462.1 hypothetical protein [Intrasporangium sp.]
MKFAHSSGLRSILPVPLLSTRLTVALLMVPLCVWVVLLPYAFVFIEISRNLTPRGVSPYEYCAAIAGVLLAVVCACRLPEFEATGLRRVAFRAVICNLLPAVGASLVVALGIATYPAGARPPASTLWPLLNNAVAVGLIAAITVALLGVATGSLVAVTVAGVNWWAQAVYPASVRWLPFNWASTEDGLHDRSVHVVWLTVLLLVAVAIGQGRRNIPLWRSKIRELGCA